MKDHLINHARTFIFSTALPPYFAEQISTAVKLVAGMDAARQRLFEHANGINQELRRAEFDTGGSASQIVPVILGSNEDTLGAAAHLQADGFAVRAIRPPTVPAGRARLRFSLTVEIAEEELKRLAKSLREWRAGKAPAVTAGYA
jgi:8-amino-7-oxononanoate synthase